jgi:hypothetical protein
MIFGLATFRKDLVPQSAQCLLWSFHPSGQTARNTHPTIGALQSDALPLRPNRCPWLSPPVASHNIARDGALRRDIPHNQTDPPPLMLASEQFRCWADWHVFRRLGGVWRGLKLFLAARQIMNVQALFHYQERGIALTASRLFIKRMVSPDSRIFSPTFKVWALKIIGDNRSAHLTIMGPNQLSHNCQ